jgi:hypothetical protein
MPEGQRDWNEQDWDELFARGGALCSFCGKVVDDRRYAVALQIHRAWDTRFANSRYAHIQCLNKALTKEFHPPDQ